MSVENKSGKEWPPAVSSSPSKPLKVLGSILQAPPPFPNSSTLRAPPPPPQVSFLLARALRQGGSSSWPRPFKSRLLTFGHAPS